MMPAAFVIAQHLDPKHRSMLASLLERYTRMAVLEITHKQPVEANRIYITPPGSDVTLSGNTLLLSKPASAIGPKPSVDYFFTSLAEDKGHRSVGIILSGTGSDGAHGIRAIKAGGGITIVQEEDTAKYDGMPRAAIETGHVDLVLPPEKIGQELQVVVKYPHLVPTVPPETEAPADISRIIQLLTERTGTRFSDYKLSTVNRRMGRRMALDKIVSLADYVRYIENNPKELDALFKDILISVTSFFRDPGAFQAMDHVLGDIIKSKRTGDNIRIWIPGCATGEEAYSMAILLAERLGEKINQYNIQIFASDLDQDAIVRGRRGIYPTATVVDVDKALYRKYFTHEDNTVQINKSIRETLVFAKQDLTKDPPFSHLDIICCRNLLIYFNTRLQEKIIKMFHYILNPGGVLFLGKSETIGQFADLFEPIVKKWRIFKRRETMRAPAVDLGLSHSKGYQAAAATKAPPRIDKNAPIREAFSTAVTNAYAHSGVLIDNRQDVIYVHGNVTPYLSLAPGVIGVNILNMARPELRLDLRALIHKATRENRFIRSREIPFVFENTERSVLLHIGPAISKEIQENGAVVLFEEVPPKSESNERALTKDQLGNLHLTELEVQVASLREHLQVTVDDLETANEELQSLNEELQSANEELQSSNEELETSNEELQSTNEELNTVNEELQVKSGELAAANSDLENILKSVGVAMLIVDKELRVNRFTPPANKLFKVTGSDLGRVITTIPTQLSFPDFRETLLTVLETAEPVQQDMDVEGRSYQMRALPYLDEKGRSVGVMLMFLDRTDLRDSEERFRAIFEQSLDSVVLVDAETGDLVEFNAKTCESLGYTHGELKRKNIFDLGTPEAAEEVNEHLKRTLKDGFEIFETYQMTKNGQSLKTQVSSRAVAVQGKQYVQSVWWRY